MGIGGWGGRTCIDYWVGIKREFFSISFLFFFGNNDNTYYLHSAENCVSIAETPDRRTRCRE